MFLGGLRSAPQKVEQTTTLPPRPIDEPSPFFAFLQSQFEAAKQKDPQANILRIASDAVEEWDKNPTVRKLQREENKKALEKHRPWILSKGMSDQYHVVPLSKLMKEPSAPKKPRTAYVLFLEDKREEVRLQNPSMRSSDIGLHLGNVWKNLDEGAKNVYEERYKTSLVEYENQLKIWNEFQQK